MNVRRLILGMVASLCAMTGGLSLCSVSAVALRTHSFGGSFGEACSASPCGNGQFSGPDGVAVNESTGEVYVVDTGDGRVERFSATGTYESQFNGSAAPTGALSSPTGIALDNSTNPLDSSVGDVYVIDAGHDVIDKFDAGGTYLGQLSHGASGAPFGELDGVAVDATGEVWVYQASGEIDNFSDGLTNVFIESRSSPFEKTNPGFTVDSEDDLYVRRGSPFIAKLSSSGGTLIEAIAGEEESSGLAVNLTSNEVYVDNVGSVGVFTTTPSAGTLVDRFGSGHLTSGSGIAVDATTGAVYVADSAMNVVDIFNAVVLPDVSTGGSSNITETGVTLSGSVNPAGLPVTSCAFEYGTEASYGSSAACEPAVGSGTNPVAVHADLSGLQPGTLYHYRLTAANAKGSNPGEDRTFIAPASPKIDGESVSDVASSSATLQAQINPGGRDTKYRFEYGPTTAYGASLPVPDGTAGSGLSDVTVTAHPQDLLPGTTYHYRVVAENELDAGVEGKDHTFVTESTGSEFSLPDNRQWEMVSEPDKHGAALEAIAHEGAVIQAAEDGNGLAYAASAPTEPNPGGNPAPGLSEIISTRHADGGWSSQDIATRHDQSTGIAVGSPTEYRLFSPDLTSAVLKPLGETPLSQEATERTPYLRHNVTCETSPTTCYQPLVTAGNVPPGTKFSSAYEEPTFGGATPDLKHIILESRVALTSTPIVGGISGAALYEWTAGKLQLASVLPTGEGGAAVDVTFGQGSDVRHAISDNGSRIVWAYSPSFSENRLYMRDLLKGQTVRLDIVENGALGGVNKPVFQTASSDGSRVFFTDTAQLTVNSTASGPGFPPKSDLYEFDVETGKLTDLTVDLNAGEQADVQGGVFGASEDASYVYFVANGVLAQGATPGKCSSEDKGATCNLYVRHDGVTTFIADLSNEDANFESMQNGLLGDLTARVSPDGRWFAFMSDRGLTGYDNRDAISGEPDEEVFLYDAGANRLACVSCDPTGARPEGAFDSGGFPGLLVDRSLIWGGHWLAASIPGWTNEDLADARYQSRYLSDSGRMFFNSHDALVPQDTNGTWDVYEYEPDGADGCESASATFSEGAGGCVGPISSGSSGEESAFLDASANGDDVFFLTGARLAPQDYDSALDIYDARVCSSVSPCLAVPPSGPPPCSTGDSCKPPPSPQPPIFGAPASATFSGAGNVTPVSGRVVVPKSLSRAQRLASALKACEKRRPKHKRVSCVRQAKRRYAASTTRSRSKVVKSLSVKRKG